MSDTYLGECRICGEDTDLMNGICLECQCELEVFERWLKSCAGNHQFTKDEKDIIIAYVRIV